MDILNIDDEIKNNTSCAVLKGIFGNDEEIAEKLGTVDMKTFFDCLKKEVSSFYKNFEG